MPRILVLILLIALTGTYIVCAGPWPAAATDDCPGARPVAEARGLPSGAQVTVRGSVTVPTGAYTAGQSFAVQDATGGVYVYRQAGIGQKLVPGDNVCVTGRLSLYHGLLELMPASPRQIVRLGSGSPLAPRAIEPGQIGEKTEGLLVSITGPVSGLGERRFRVGRALVFLDATTGITTTGLSEGCPVTVIGLSASYDGAQVWPRTPADVIPGACSTGPCTDLTIAQIQGRSSASPYDGRKALSCVAGCVTGVGAKGFYLQSVRPDGDLLTSEGLFVFRWDGWTNPRGLRLGDLVEVRDFGVQEFYNSTEIIDLRDDSEASYRRVGTCELPAPIAIPPLTDPEADPEALYEPLEGMRVALSFDGRVVGPTTRYLSRFPAGDPEIAVVDRQSPLYRQPRVFAGDLPPGRGMVYLSGGLGQDLPDVSTGQRLSASNLTGVLAYQFGRYVLLVDGEAPPVTADDAPHVTAAEAPFGSAQNRPIGPDEFAMCTFNLENLFDAVDDDDGDLGEWAPADRQGFDLLIKKRAAAIREDLRRCTVIGVQELEGKDAVWEALAAAVGKEFRYDYYESADERDITNGILYDSSRVALRRSDQAQACTPGDYGVDYAVARGPRARRNPCGLGSHPLFDRPPYVADLVLRNARGDRSLDVTVVVNHFKSKLGDEAANQPQRIAQARHVASLLTAPNSVALGDFNDSLGSPTLAQFTGFVNLYEAHLPRADRYTYIYNGQSEVLDHFIMTSGLDRYFKSGGPIHINADFPDRRALDNTSRRSSDHDPVFVRFGFRPTGVGEALAGLVTGAVGGR